MQTKKRISGRNAPREPASPRISRAQKKLLENLQVAEKKVSELITSSARKQKCGMLLLFFYIYFHFMHACTEYTVNLFLGRL
jgi:hypothetical protein